MNSVEGERPRSKTGSLTEAAVEIKKEVKKSVEKLETTITYDRALVAEEEELRELIGD